MTSKDNAIDMTRLELLLREHFARTDKQLSDFRAENAEFHTKLINEAAVYLRGLLPTYCYDRFNLKIPRKNLTKLNRCHVLKKI
ncbi:MAG: hypothetical protein IJU07_01345 [Synergistaceae bacterium]|nr:hypothetical protein [Synergistaceae bacterium]